MQEADREQRRAERRGDEMQRRRNAEVQRSRGPALEGSTAVCSLVRAAVSHQGPLGAIRAELTRQGCCEPSGAIRSHQGRAHSSGLL